MSISSAAGHLMHCKSVPPVHSEHSCAAYEAVMMLRRALLRLRAAGGSAGALPAPAPAAAWGPAPTSLAARWVSCRGEGRGPRVARAGGSRCRRRPVRTWALLAARSAHPACLHPPPALQLHAATPAAAHAHDALSSGKAPSAEPPDEGPGGGSFDKLADLYLVGEYTRRQRIFCAALTGGRAWEPTALAGSRLSWGRSCTRARVCSFCTKPAGQRSSTPPPRLPCHLAAPTHPSTNRAACGRRCSQGCKAQRSTRREACTERDDFMPRDASRELPPPPKRCAATRPSQRCVWPPLPVASAIQPKRPPSTISCGPAGCLRAQISRTARP